MMYEYSVYKVYKRLRLLVSKAENIWNVAKLLVLVDEIMWTIVLLYCMCRFYSTLLLYNMKYIR